MNLQFKKWIAWVFVGLWMGVIFYLSHQPADESSALSSGIVQSIISAIETITRTSISDTDWMHYIVRKGAHLFAYFFLAILFMNACKQMGWKRIYQVIIALVGCALYATTDEVHQLFIPGRSGEVKDVLIDTVGASIGIVTFLVMHTWIERFNRNKKSA